MHLIYLSLHFFFLDLYFSFTEATKYIHAYGTNISINYLINHESRYPANDLTRLWTE